MRLAFSIAALALMVSCAHQPTARVKSTRALTAEESRIVEIARQAVATSDTWVAQAQFETPKRSGQGWSVRVWRLPYTPGGHRTVLINETGEVTAYYRGE